MNAAMACCRDVRSGAVLARCSQPEIGLFGWREEKDELIIQAILAACTFNDGQPSPPHTPNGQSLPLASNPHPHTHLMVS